MGITFTMFDLNNCESLITYPQTIRVGTGIMPFEDVVDVSEIDATPEIVEIDAEDVLDVLRDEIAGRHGAFTKSELIRALGITLQDVAKAHGVGETIEISG